MRKEERVQDTWKEGWNKTMEKRGTHVSERQREQVRKDRREKKGIEAKRELKEQSKSNSSHQRTMFAKQHFHIKAFLIISNTFMLPYVTYNKLSLFSIILLDA